MSRGPAIAGSSAYFDRLVQLIPAKYYVPEEHDPERGTYFKGKSAKAAAKQANKEQSKKGKRAKLDPDGPQSALDVQRQRAAADSLERETDARARDDDDDDDDDDDADDGDDDDDDGDGDDAGEKTGRKRPSSAPSPGLFGNGFNADGATHEQLRERLRARIDEFRSKRHAEERVTAAQSAKDWRSGAKGRAPKTGSKPRGKGKGKAAVANGAAQGPSPGGPSPGGLPKSKGKPAVAGATPTLQFSRVQLPGGTVSKGAKRRSSPAAALARAEGVKAALAASAGTPAGAQLAAHHAWGAAMQRALGEKVLDDPKLLRKALKRDDRATAKSSAAWAERAASTAEGQKAKQAKRADNLKARATAVKDKKIAKREKKLMRPGFEGRKQGFINKK